MSIGAAPVDLDKVQLHPTSFIDPKDPLNPTKILGPEALRGSGGILVNQAGVRFVNELDLRSVVSAAIMGHCQKYRCQDGQAGNHFAWCILNAEAQRKFGLPSLKFYQHTKGLFEAAPDFPSLARDVIGCDPAALRATIEAYGKAAALGMDTATHKNTFPALFAWDDKDLVAARVTPAIHYTMGGLRISAAAEVLEEAQVDAVNRYSKLRPIRRLFAAGEVTGGVHGENRLGGNSLLECVVFGRLAGERAGTIKQRNAACLTEEDWTPVTFREALQTDKTHGLNTMVFRFNCHGALQLAGLAVGQFVAIRGELDGEWLQGYYSPLSRPQEEGYVEILCRTDVSGGKVVDFLSAVRPGGECYLKAMGGLRLEFDGGKIYHEGREVKQVSLLAGGTGIAPMVQIVRAYLYHRVGEGALAGAPGLVPDPDPASAGVRLVYAAEREFDLAFTSMLESMEAKYAQHFRHYVVLNQPSLGWTEGVGFVDDDTVKKYLFFPPQEDAGQLFVICGPPIFELMMCKMLLNLGYPRTHIFAYSNPVV
jgi:ferredoxin-NADP reductase